MRGKRVECSRVVTWLEYHYEDKRTGATAFLVQNEADPSGIRWHAFVYEPGENRVKSACSRYHCNVSKRTAQRYVKRQFDDMANNPRWRR